MTSLLFVNEEEVLKPAMTFMMSALCCGILLFFALFLHSINHEYFCTFHDTRTGPKFLEDSFFNENHSDEQKFEILTNHEGMWAETIGEDVKEWMDNQLPVWLEESPQWFDAHGRARISDWLIDDKELLKEIRNDEVQAIRYEAGTLRTKGTMSMRGRLRPGKTVTSMPDPEARLGTKAVRWAPPVTEGWSSVVSE